MVRGRREAIDLREAVTEALRRAGVFLPDGASQEAATPADGGIASFDEAAATWLRHEAARGCADATR